MLRPGITSLVILSCAGCAKLGFLHPAGPVARDESELFLRTLELTLIVIMPVILFTPWLIWWYRRSNSRARYRPHWDSSRTLEILAWGVPVAIVTVLSVLLWKSSYRLDPYRPLPNPEAPLKIQVIGLNWKWLFIYPEQHVSSVNQLAIPVGRPVNLVITSDTVMQSLLIPKLSGQIYAMAGMRTHLHLQSDHSGTFTGENTQYNGNGFAKQKFQVLSLPARKFYEWVKHARQSTSTLDCASYSRLSNPGLLEKPVFYRNDSPQLFDQIVSAYREKPMSSCSETHAGNKHG